MKNTQLSQTEARIVQSAKLAGLGYAITNSKTNRVVECDDTYAGLHGLTVDEFLSLDVEDGIIGQLVHEEDRAKSTEDWQRVIKGENVVNELRYVLPNGEIRSLRKIFSPPDPSKPDADLVEIVGQDVTNTRDLQNQLAQSQKMEALGQLTGGVAHDFNNLLAVTLGNLELLDDEVENPDLKKLIKNSIASTIRGADLTRNMLSFARKAPLEPSVVDLNQLVKSMQSWIGRTLPSTIKIETKLAPDLWKTEVDPSSTESGLLNLILNARDAMPDGGTLAIETSNVTIEPGRLDLPGDSVGPRPYVLLCLRDTGEGISTENLQKVFEPFFTTKPVGKGSGLGLSMLHGFMKQSRGAVRVHSEPGKGTNFQLYFRALTDEKIKEPTPAGPVGEDTSESRATILIVEDNAEVLSVFTATLRNKDYRILQATSGDEALLVFKQNPGIDLLLTDIVMPGVLQGITLAKELRELRPNLPVIFMSGYSSEASVEGNGLLASDICLMKPVLRETLLRSIDKVLSVDRQE
jgi:signal transduction histidine kinase/ActR/RegA family two-component response regulator